MAKNRAQLLEDAQEILQSLPEATDGSFELLESKTKKELEAWIAEHKQTAPATTTGTTASTETTTASTSDVLESSNPKQRSSKNKKEVYKCISCDFRSRNKKSKCSRHPLTKLKLQKRK